MKIESVTLQKFKRFDRLRVQLRNDAIGEVANQFLILGDNGTGKTTVLQAIALCLSLVSRRIRTISELDWMGWVPGRYWRWGRPQVEMIVHFSDDEIEATREAASRWNRVRRHHPDEAAFIEPPQTNVVRIGLDGDRYWVNDPDRFSAPPELYLFRGRSYVASILDPDPGARALFERLPGFFWFDQFPKPRDSSGLT